MAQTTVYNLIPQTAHPVGSDPVEVIGDPYQAAAYILSNRDLQTISWHFSGTFAGDARIEATLVTNPSETDWYTVYEIDTVSSLDGYHNLTGNFVWLRAVVDNWTTGTIQLITVSY